MKNKKLTLLGVTMCSVLLLTTGCGEVAKLKDGKEVVGKIKGYTVTAEDLYAELKEQGGSRVFVNMIDDYIANKEIKSNEDAEDYANSQIEAYKSQYEQQGQDFNEVLVSSGYKNEQQFRDELILSYKKDKVVENYLKDELTDDEIQNSCNLAKKYGIELILQPEMVQDKMSVSSEFAASILDKFLDRYENVRLIPQVHKFLDVR